MSDFDTVIDGYLTELQSRADTNVYQQHREVVENFRGWCGDACTSEDHLTEQLVAQYLQYRRQPDGDTHYTTYNNALQNLLSYAKQKDPELVDLHISEEQVWIVYNLGKINLEDPLAPPESHTHPHVDPTEERLTARAIDEARSYLDENAFAELPHAYLELLLASTSDRHDLHRINMNDIDFEDQIVDVPFAGGDSLVTDLGLVERHRIKFTDYTTQVLRRYIEGQSGVEDDAPLFSTASGRMSVDTLHHRFRDVIDDAASYARETTGESAIEKYTSQRAEQLTPSLILRAAGVPEYVKQDRIYHW